MEEEEEETAGFGELPANALEEILVRIPASARRRLRLVCRHWRDVVDDRTPERRSRAKTLVYVSRPAGAAAYVLDDDDLVEGRRCRELWSSSSAAAAAAAANPDRRFRFRMVGTLNGLLCLYEELAGETPLHIRGPAGNRLDPAALSFAYLETTGQYKIVHLRHLNISLAAQVLTVGEGASWRNVPAPAGTSCSLYSGIANVGGATYWISKDTNMLMSFDLTDERFARATPLPAASPAPDWLAVNCLKEVGGGCGGGMVGIVAYASGWCGLEMWVLERGGGGWRLDRKKTRWRWRRRFSVPPRVGPHDLVGLRFGHGHGHGENVLTKLFGDSTPWCVSGGGARRAQCQCSVVCIDPHRSFVQTFSYVETTEGKLF
uniref:F-box domain-containing protein n=1 Tax=Oryza meridionalis TaxID=40149 RepID=A0A0E0EMN8_9ORYZ